MQLAQRRHRFAFLSIAVVLGACAVKSSGPGADQRPSATLAAVPASPCSSSLTHEQLAVPDGNVYAFALGAKGMQVYRCSDTRNGPGWVFVGPEANLFDAGMVAGSHGSGPFWEAVDGSRVVGAKVAEASPDSSAIPWLLLRAVSHSRKGRMESVTFIHRVFTVGGMAPQGGCDGSGVAAGTLARIPYTATYCFYSSAMKEPRPAITP